MNKAYLLTGGNLGNRGDNLRIAGNYIEQYCGKIVQRSSVYETAAWGLEDQPDFYNQVVCVETSLVPSQLMSTVLDIEQQMGRMRTIRMGPRSIDIDILFYGHLIINESLLTIPHPRIQERRFVLTPLAEIAPDMEHPVFHKTIGQLLTECSDTLNVYKIE